MPDTPLEPDPEVVPRSEPRSIPLFDVTGSGESVCDHRGIPWPDPVFNQPPDFFGGGNRPPRPQMAPNMHPHAPQWGGPPPPGQPFGNAAGPPMYPGGPPGAGYGPPTSGVGNGMVAGFPAPHGPQDMDGWGAPNDYPPPGGMMMSGGGPPPLLGSGPPGPMMAMMGGGNNGPPPPQPQRNNNGGGGKGHHNRFRGGRGPNNIPCKHHLIGRCRNGNNCNFMHSRP